MYKNDGNVAIARSRGKLTGKVTAADWENHFKQNKLNYHFLMATSHH